MSADKKQVALVRIVKNMIGVNASNTEIVNRMRKATDNVANGEPWCVCFVQWAVREVDALAIELGIVSPLVHKLPKTESTQELWRLAPEAMRSNVPVPGRVAVWRLEKNPALGHCGIVIGVGTDGAVLTVEGNTSMANAGSFISEAERNGNGVWMKRRAGGGQIPGFKLLGFISPWG